MDLSLDLVHGQWQKTKSTNFANQKNAKSIKAIMTLIVAITGGLNTVHISLCLNNIWFLLAMYTLSKNLYQGQ